MEWICVRKEELGTIMKTDIVCEISCLPHEKVKAETLLEEAFDMFRDFESRYSRFIQDNELWRFNESEESVLSAEFIALLKQSQIYYAQTGGIFNPSILPVLESSGYVGAYTEYAMPSKGDFSKLVIDEALSTTKKPKDLKIDLGGIGKGFVVDKVATFLGQHFDNFFVDAGGDIAVRGVNKTESYPYWAIDLEHPVRREESALLLVLTNVSVATSGRNRRHWVKQGEVKHHIIDPRTEVSASSDLLSVTVIGKDTVYADVFAKTLFIAGKEKGLLMADALKIPVIFIDKDGLVTRNHFVETYVWKA